MTMSEDASATIHCPVCSTAVPLGEINSHLDNNCQSASGPDSQSSNAPSSITPSFFTPTQSRSFLGKKEVPETPSSELRTSQKRKVDEYEDRHPHVGADISMSGKGATVPRDALPGRSQPRGKEAIQQAAPLADRVRPKSLDDFIGQGDLVGKSGILRGLIDAGRVPSMILWGASGTGKTTLARIIARSSLDVEYIFRELSATSNNVADCKRIFEEASNLLTLTGKRTMVFLDEIHRFTKSQQDVFLPYVESGKITLIGATTENPSFRINNALISRCRVFVLAKLSLEDVRTILVNALRQLGEEISSDIVDFLAGLCDGDARVALNLLEMVLSLPRETLTMATIRASLKRTTIAYDMKGDEHYDCISALHKSIRGGDVDASLYYLGRMLQGGEDPLYVARRMVRIASEDVGMADVSALPLCSSIYTAVQQVGMPEADCLLAQGVVHLATAPKSVSVYRAYKAVKACLRDEPGAASAPVPLHLRNAPTGLMRQLGHGDGYVYNPDHVGEAVEQTYLPAALLGREFYVPDTERDTHGLWSELDEGERLL